MRPFAAPSTGNASRKAFIDRGRAARLYPVIKLTKTSHCELRHL
nr:MAG TPA: hypothetical protein [Caudoviricetes sp.]